MDLSTYSVKQLLELKGKIKVEIAHKRRLFTSVFPVALKATLDYGTDSKTKFYFGNFHFYEKYTANLGEIYGFVTFADDSIRVSIMTCTKEYGRRRLDYYLIEEMPVTVTCSIPYEADKIKHWVSLFERQDWGAMKSP